MRCYTSSSTLLLEIIFFLFWLVNMIFFLKCPEKFVHKHWDSINTSNSESIDILNQQAYILQVSSWRIFWLRWVAWSPFNNILCFIIQNFSEGGDYKVSIFRCFLLGVRFYTKVKSYYGLYGVTIITKRSYWLWLRVRGWCKKYKVHLCEIKLWLNCYEHGIKCVDATPVALT